MLSKFRLNATPVLLLALAAVAWPLATLSSAMNATVTVALLYAIFTVGLYVFVGNSGVFSFGHMGFAMVGGYAASLLAMPEKLKRTLLPNAPEMILSTGLPPWLAVIVGGLLATVVAAVLAWPLSRLSGLAAGLATVSVLMSMKVIATNWRDVTKGAAGLSSNLRTTTVPVALAWLGVALILAWTFQRSSVGRRLRASSSDETAATAAGVNTPMVRSLAFAVSAFITGVGGALFGMHTGSVSPTTFYLNGTFLVITMMVIGGVRSLTGALLGSVLVSALTEITDIVESGSVFGLFAIPKLPGLGNIVLGLLLVLILLRRPGGLVGNHELRWPRFGRARPDPSGPPAPDRPAAGNDADRTTNTSTTAPPSTPGKALT